MKQILQKIVKHKVQEIAQRQQQLTLSELQQQVAEAPAARDFVQALKSNYPRPGIIAEVKKASPSRGIIRADFEPVAIARAYERGGANCISVLTDRQFFQGSFDNLRLIRQQVALPLLCKEFILASYQIYLARAMGADAVLLIAAILTDSKLQEFLALSHDLGMEALVEVHTRTELDRVLRLKQLRLLGINNRNLENFNVNLATTLELIEQRRDILSSSNLTLVSESGIKTKADLDFVAQAGANAVLVGESLVKQTNIEQALTNFASSQPVA
ncbi:MAG TPA: indole-3-glycerol phosphate synthase TrpC [Xenococcaceae cyanobacterium]